jgi:hypothetical protein
MIPFDFFTWQIMPKNLIPYDEVLWRLINFDPYAVHIVVNAGNTHFYSWAQRINESNNKEVVGLDILLGKDTVGIGDKGRVHLLFNVHTGKHKFQPEELWLCMKV